MKSREITPIVFLLFIVLAVFLLSRVSSWPVPPAPVHATPTSEPIEETPSGGFGCSPFI